jgi:DNA-binding SARP family transcriptional activator
MADRHPHLVYRLLGPLDVVVDGSVVPIRAARHRAVLALLLLSANRFVSRDVLIDRVWNGTPPDGAVKTVQSYVSRLRTLLDGAGPRLGVVVAGHGGRAYRLEVAPEAVDTTVFTGLVADGRTALDTGSSRT